MALEAPSTTTAPTTGEAKALPANPTPPAYDAVCERAVRCTTSKLYGRYGFRDQDKEDIAQELALGLLERIGDFDPSRSSWRTFVERCVAKAAASIIRYRTAQCRHAGRAADADLPVHVHAQDDADERDEVEYSDQPERSGIATVVDRRSEQALHNSDRVMDFEVVQARLTPFQLTVCECLKHHRPEVAPGVLGVKRWRVWRAITQIRAVMEEVGIDDVG